MVRPDSSIPPHGTCMKPHFTNVLPQRFGWNWLKDPKLTQHKADIAMCGIWLPKFLTTPVIKDLESKENSCVCLKVDGRAGKGTEQKGACFVRGSYVAFSSGADGQVQMRRHAEHTRFNSTRTSSLCPWQEFCALLVCDGKALNEAPNGVFRTESQVASHGCMCRFWDILLPYSQVPICSFSVGGKRKPILGISDLLQVNFHLSRYEVLCKTFKRKQRSWWEASFMDTWNPWSIKASHLKKHVTSFSKQTKILISMPTFTLFSPRLFLAAELAMLEISIMFSLVGKFHSSAPKKWKLYPNLPFAFRHQSKRLTEPVNKRSFGTRETRRKFHL